MNIVTNILPLFITIFMFHCYDLPVILIPNSTQISGLFSKKILLSVTVYWTTFIPNTMLILSFVIPKTMYCFYMSGNRNEHLLGQIVMKSWCEMSLSRFTWELQMMFKYTIIFSFQRTFFTSITNDQFVLFLK